MFASPKLGPRSAAAGDQTRAGRAQAGEQHGKAASSASKRSPAAAAAHPGSRGFEAGRRACEGRREGLATWLNCAVGARHAELPAPANRSHSRCSVGPARSPAPKSVAPGSTRVVSSRYWSCGQAHGGISGPVGLTQAACQQPASSPRCSADGVATCLVHETSAGGVEQRGAALAGRTRDFEAERLLPYREAQALVACMAAACTAAAGVVGGQELRGAEQPAGHLPARGVGVGELQGWGSARQGGEGVEGPGGRGRKNLLQTKQLGCTP